LVRKKVEVVNYPDGRFAVQFNGATLGFKVFDKIQTVQPGAIVDNKRLAPYWSRSRRSRPPTRRGSSAGTLRGGDRPTTSKRRVCRRRGVHHATAAFPCTPFNGDATGQAGHHRAVARVGFSGIGRSTPMACRDGGLATTEWRDPASSDRLPIHRSESPTGYSSAASRARFRFTSHGQ